MDPELISNMGEESTAFSKTSGYRSRQHALTPPENRRPR
jgi:hypothetical protein